MGKKSEDKEMFTSNWHDYMVLLLRDQKNIEIGRKEGRILGFISVLREMGFADAVIIQKLQEKYELDEQEAKEFLKRACREI